MDGWINEGMKRGKDGWRTVGKEGWRNDGQMEG